MTTKPTTAATTLPAGSVRKTASAAGWLYLVTFATSIPALALYGAVLNDPASAQVQTPRS
jgi:hypothetical protein